MHGGKKGKSFNSFFIEKFSTESIVAKLLYWVYVLIAIARVKELQLYQNTKPKTH